MKTFQMEKTIPLNMITMETLPTRQIISDRYELAFTIITETSDTSAEGLLMAQYEQNISFAKIVTFIEEYINNAVIFEADVDADTEIYNFLNKWENNLVVLPDLHESTLIAAIHCKLNTISSENTFVDKVSLTDKTQNITYHYILTEHTEGYSELPDIADWMGEFSYFADPWWTQADTRTVDRPAKDQEELDKWKARELEANYQELCMQPFTDIESSVKEIFKQMSGEFSEETVKEGEVVDLEQFKTEKKWTPKLV